jgi:hypothetical protein
VSETTTNGGTENLTYRSTITPNGATETVVTGVTSRGGSTTFTVPTSVTSNSFDFVPTTYSVQTSSNAPAYKCFLVDSSNDSQY